MMQEPGHGVQGNSKLLKVAEMCILVPAWFKRCSEGQRKSLKGLY